MLDGGVAGLKIQKYLSFALRKKKKNLIFFLNSVQQKSTKVRKEKERACNVETDKKANDLN